MELKIIFNCLFILYIIWKLIIKFKVRFSLFSFMARKESNPCCIAMYVFSSMCLKKWTHHLSLIGNYISSSSKTQPIHHRPYVQQTPRCKFRWLQTSESPSSSRVIVFAARGCRSINSPKAPAMGHLASPIFPQCSVGEEPYSSKLCTWCESCVNVYENFGTVWSAKAN